MQTKIQSIHFDADIKLLSFIEKKVEKLKTFFAEINNAEVFLRLDKASNNENKIVEIKLALPGNELFAKRQSKSFEEATDEAVEALRRQVRRHKGKVKEIQG